MKIRFALGGLVLLTACALTLNPPPNPTATDSPSPRPTAQVIKIGLPSPSASSGAMQPSTRPSTSQTSGPTSTTGPTASPAPTTTPTPTPRPLWSRIEPGVEVLEEGVLSIPREGYLPIRPRRPSGVVVRTGAPGTSEAGKQELWIQFNQLPINLTKSLPCDLWARSEGGDICSSLYDAPGFVAYDTATATWSFRAMSSDFGCQGNTTVYDSSSGYRFYYIAPCHPDNYPTLARAPVISADDSGTFTVKVQGATVASVPITDDFRRVAHPPMYYLKEWRGGKPLEEYGNTMAGYTAWANERLYNSTFTRDTGKAAVVWWSKSDNAWRITDLAFLSIPAGSYLYDTTPLYLAVDPVSGAFFFVVPENNVYQLYRLDRAETTSRVPYQPYRYWGRVYKVAADYIHDNGVLVSVR
ncbi:MAG: hypothetical protein AAB416_01710 [Patescibacteria group bacterium]